MEGGRSKRVQSIQANDYYNMGKKGMLEMVENGSGKDNG